MTDPAAKMEVASPSAADVNIEKGEGEDPSATFDAEPNTVKVERAEEGKNNTRDPKNSSSLSPLSNFFCSYKRD